MPPTPTLAGPVVLTDGGIETTLIFDDGFDLPDFAAFVLLDDPAGRAALERYFDAYVAIARRDGVDIVLETPTWRASSDWGARLGYDADALDRVNRDAVALVRSVAEGSGAAVHVSGCLGPRGDGYVPGQLMSAEEARHYHLAQVRSLAAGGADLIGAITMIDPAEAIGIAEAARTVGLPSVIAFTVETDGTLPTGLPLADAIRAVDEATDGAPLHYMVNCAHPTHFADVLEPGSEWTARLGGVRANASRLSHAELDAAEELDAGDPAELAELYAELRAVAPSLRVFGGCCGTSHVHIDAISTRLGAASHLA